MDPIKVDFSNKGKSAQKEIVIPPENAGLKIVIGLVLTAITAFIAYYIMLPALNPKDTTLYMYLGVVAASYVVFQALLSKALTKPASPASASQFSLLFRLSDTLSAHSFSEPRHTAE